jgi:uncharacterized protein (DUF2147 family)
MRSGGRSLLAGIPLLLAALLIAGHGAAAATDISGRWLTQGGDGVIQIARCGAGYCGRIVGMSQTHGPDGSILRDNQGRPKCGLTILRVSAGSDAGKWNGHITNPDDGKVYDSELSVDPQGRLHLRGYVLTPLLGQTQIWTKYSGAIDASCQMR